MGQKQDNNLKEQNNLAPGEWTERDQALYLKQRSLIRVYLKGTQRTNSPKIKRSNRKIVKRKTTQRRNC